METILLGLSYLFLPFIILMPKISLFKVGGTAVGIRLEDFVVLAMLLVGLVALWRRRQTRVIGKQLWLKWWLLFMLWALLTSIFGIVVLKTVSHPTVALLNWGRYCEFGVVAFTALLVNWTPQRLKRLCVMGLAATVLEFGYALLQLGDLVPYFSTLQSLWQTTDVKFRSVGVVMGTFGGHYDFGLFAVFVCCAVLLGLGQLQQIEQWLDLKPAISRLLLAGIGVMGMVCLLLTKSRSAYLAMIVVVGLHAWQTRNKKLILLAAVLVAALTGVYLTGKISNRPVQTTVGSVAVVIDESSVARTNKWLAILRNDNPVQWVTGGGLAAMGDAVDGYYLRLIGETGLVGLGLFLVMIVVLLQTYFYAPKHQSAAAKTLHQLLLFWTVALLVQAVFIDIFVSSKIMFIYWLMLGIGISPSLNEALS